MTDLVDHLPCTHDVQSCISMPARVICAQGDVLSIKPVEPMVLEIACISSIRRLTASEENDMYDMHGLDVTQEV